MDRKKVAWEIMEKKIDQLHTLQDKIIEECQKKMEKISNETDEKIKQLRKQYYKQYSG